LAEKKAYQEHTKFDQELVDQVRDQQSEPRPLVIPRNCAVVDIAAMQDQVEAALRENKDAHRRLIKLKTELAELAAQQATHNKENADE